MRCRDGCSGAGKWEGVGTCDCIAFDSEDAAVLTDRRGSAAGSEFVDRRVGDRDGAARSGREHGAAGGGGEERRQTGDAVDCERAGSRVGEGEDLLLRLPGRDVAEVEWR